MVCLIKSILDKWHVRMSVKLPKDFLNSYNSENCGASLSPLSGWHCSAAIRQATPRHFPSPPLLIARHYTALICTTRHYSAPHCTTLFALSFHISCLLPHHTTPQRKQISIHRKNQFSVLPLKKEIPIYENVNNFTGRSYEIKIKFKYIVVYLLPWSLFKSVE